jgi:molybdopterin-guanine dinucleotide biosynthesis protein
MKRPILIGIGASHSGSGKTTLAATILKHYTDRSVRPLTNHESRITSCTWGAIKYTRTRNGPELITDLPMLMKRGKDTWQMLTSGAREVVWVRSARSGLRELLPKALKRLSHLDLIIVEGNSAIEFLKPDIVIFIFGEGRQRWKPGIEELAAGADIVLNASEVKLPVDSQTKKLFPRSLSGSEYNIFFGTLTGIIHERRAEAGNDRKGS